MASRLSAQAKPFEPKQQKQQRVGGNIVSWNVLSDSLTESIRQCVSSTPNVALFPKKVFDKRSDSILHKLKEMIKVYRSPIFCLQEVNDSVHENQCLMRILKRFLQEHHYRVLTTTFGTSDQVYPELGLLTAVPMHTYDIVSYSIQQIDVSAPNAFVFVHLRTKGVEQKEFHLVNTHFPARFDDSKFMRKYTKKFVDYWEGFRNLVVCGDMNTRYEDEWYRVLAKEWKTLQFRNHMTHLSIQRRDRRSAKNKVFQGFLDHVFWTSPLIITYIEVPPMALTPEELKMMETPRPNDPLVIPSASNPSDHYPLVVRFQFPSSSSS